MQGGSARAQEAVVAVLDEVLAGGDDAAPLGRDLFAIVGMLDREAMLRRVLTEPSVDLEARTALARSVLEGKVSKGALRVVEAAVGQRWSRGRDIVDALEWCAVTAAASKADQAGELENLEEDLFRFSRVLEAYPDLRDALSDRAAPLEVKRDLLVRLLEKKVSRVTLDLLTQLLTGRQRSLAAGLTHYQEVAAARRKRLVATVWVAQPLKDGQRRRIAELLADVYSREVHLNILTDPAVLGGVKVSVSDEVIDSTIETRLAEAKRLLLR
ncbi:MAG: F-type H+-transporting ATPase subunit delta [Nocardioidaceae bacterium]|jgi:F-type H+-transporting ATPase subunit delta|nr:F-type H+-transporting ATPase subunit delta [Nocardioidaceae bacterium]